MPFERKGRMVIVKNVPAKVCDSCGNASIDSEVARILLNFAQSMFDAGTELDIRNFDSIPKPSQASETNQRATSPAPKPIRHV
jgi:hypothetical protein